VTEDGYIDEVRAALADRYRIDRKLGEGGMASVFLALDLKHDRLVAIKVMRPEIAASLGAERFLREIQVTARLNHPHILPLYDSGEAGGVLFYVMPFVEGETLSDLLGRERQLSLDDAVRIGREMAEGLSYAHSYGLVHRDIKPDNVMLSGGHAVLADFGIARAVSEAGGDRLTQTGMAVGTPAYMSPEQAAGDPDLDGRSDLYAVGCVLYEMLVGQVPFTGPTAQAIMARHSMDAVPPPHIMRDTIPEELEDIIFCALAKLPADRFRTAGDLVEALRAVEAGQAPRVRKSTYVRVPIRARPAAWRRAVLPVAAGVGVAALAFSGWQLFGTGRPNGGTLGASGDLDPRTVAVLYFEDRSPDGAMRYVADGLTDGLITELSGVRGLDVISRNGVAPFRDPAIPRDRVARTLGAGSLVAGTVDAGGSILRVSAEVIDGNSGAPTGDRISIQVPSDSFLLARDSITGEVARLLRQRIGAEVRLRESRAGTRSAVAWSLVQQADGLWREAEDHARAGDGAAALEAFDRADSALARAARIDPAWADPVSLRGWVAYRRARLADSPEETRHWVDRAVQDADRALALARNDAAALEVRGTARYFLWLRRVTPDPAEQDRLLAEAKADLEAARDADPSRARVLSTLSHLYYQTDDAVSALMAARDAYEEDAWLDVADAILDRLFWGSYDTEQFIQATRWCQEGFRRFPDDSRFTACQLWLLTTDAQPPDVDRAWRLARSLVSLTPEGDREFQRHEAEMIVGGVLARAGLPDSADAVLRSARADPSVDPDRNLAFDEAFMRILLDQEDAAIDLLKVFLLAHPDQDHGLGHGGQLYWWWRPLRDHPRFGEVASAGS